MVDKPDQEALIVCLTSQIHDYIVVITGDDVTVLQEGEEVATETVPRLNDFLRKREGLISIGWGRTEDFNIIFIYDQTDGFGYAVNIEEPMFSEWGYAPFRPIGPKPPTDSVSADRAPGPEPEMPSSRNESLPRM